MYMVFAAVLAVAQLTALSLFPKFSAKWTRKQLYFGSMVAVCVAYILFFLAPFQNMLLIGVSGLILFFAQAFIQTLMLVFLADTVEYGHWKLGKRNESVTFAVQPFINKLGGAVGSGVVGLTLILSGINDIEQKYAAATTQADKLAAAATVQTSSLWMMKVAMLIFPLICIVVGFVLYRKKYVIDKEMYERIVEELKERE